MTERVGNRKGTTIYQKIFALIILTSIFLFSLFFCIYYYLTVQEKEVRNRALRQFDKEVTSVLELDDQTNISNIVDMVYWDEFVAYIRTKENHWFSENIVSSVETYRADYLGIYNVDGSYINSSGTGKIVARDIIPEQVFGELDKKRLLKFYVRLPEGYAQVFGASVHPTKDIYTKTSKPHGYFFIVKLLDKAYFEGIGALNNSEITFYEEPSEPADKLFVDRDLPGWNGIPVQRLLFTREFNVSFHTTENIIIILIVTYLLIVLLYLYYSRRWIYKPLNLITEILEKSDKADMDRLNEIPGEFRYIGTLLKDHDNQKRLLEASIAKAEENDRLKSSFLTNISHEIRTPMNAIIGFSNLLLSDGLEPNEREHYLKIIHTSGENLISIIDDLIEMSKIDTNQVTPNLSKVNLDACIEELYNTVRIGIPADRNLEFTIEKEPAILGFAVTDQVKLKQVMVNLVTNAVKYTEKGFVKLRCIRDRQAGNLIFTVSDSGIGIEPSEKDLIFERFHRIENKLTVKASGLGLGLAISKAYIQMLGGTISFESTTGIGTTFTFSIPVGTADADETLSDMADAKNTSVSRPVTILVAEDDNINYLLIAKMLSFDSHTVLRAKNGQEAVDICRDTPQLDLVLMDIKMPVLNGYEAFALIKECRPGLPVIAQTAYASSEDKARMEQIGFAGFVSKPINKEKLFEIIKDLIDPATDE